MDNRKRSSTSRSDSHNHGHFDNMPDFRDPADYVDDITEDELLEDILKDKPGEDVGMESLVIIDGLPVVPAEQKERQEKLKGVVRKLIIANTKCQQSDFLEEIYPVDENGATKGFCFFEFSDPEIVRNLISALDGYKFDKQHTLAVDLFTDFEKYASYPDEWEQPTVRPYKDTGNLRWFLETNDASDQYLLIFGPNGCDQASVFENTPVEPTLLEHREHWTDRQAMWSPLGSYLATFHQKGLALWGGKEFKQITRFAHGQVTAAQFSPKERYILTIRPKPDYLPVDSQAMVLWDVVTSAKKKAFSWDSRDIPSAGSVKWSPDENFFGLMSKDAINIYETETFGLQNKKPHAVPGLADFTWSPSHNYVAYWVRESGSEIPARLGLLDVTTRQDVRSKQLFSVMDCQFCWQKSGEYMAVKVTRYKHMKKGKGPNAATEFGGLFCNLEIFVLTNKKEVPVESVEIKDPIIDLAWEPNGNKLVLLTVADGTTSVNFYSGLEGAKFELIKKIPLRHKVDRISWSPMGQFVVVHTAPSSSVGYLVFIDTADLSILADVEHFVLSEVQWDPTGRYLTAITMGNNKKDNGYTLYSFQGRYIRNEKVEGLTMLAWRPRPATLLSMEKQKEIKKNLKKYAPEFEARDKMMLNKASKEVSDRRKKQMDEFMQYFTAKQRAFQTARHKRIDLRGGIDTDEIDAHPDDLVEETLEIILSVTNTPIG